MIDLLFCFMDEDHVDGFGVAEMNLTNDEHLLEHANYRIGDETRLLVQVLPEDEQNVFSGVITNYLISFLFRIDVSYFRLPLEKQNQKSKGCT